MLKGSSGTLYSQSCQQSGSQPLDPLSSSCYCQSQKPASPRPWRHHPLHRKKGENTFFHCYALSSTNSHTQALTLWQVFSSVDPHGESSPSQRQPCRPQQVSFYIFFILHTLTFVSLKQRQTHSHSDGNTENNGWKYSYWNIKFISGEFDSSKVIYMMKENFQQWTWTLFFQEATILITSLLHSLVVHLQLPGHTGWPSGILWPQQRGHQGHRAAAISSRNSVLKIIWMTYSAADEHLCGLKIH